MNMRPLFAILRLTLKAAFRFRLVVLMIGLLLGAVVVLPLIIKDDGTAQGFTQIMLTYTLGVIAVLLGFATLWLACGTLARDIEECQMQMVVVKPVARWQVWLGKWLGIVTLNALLLAISGGAVFALLQWRAQKLPPAQQAALRSGVLVARGSAREEKRDFEPEIEKQFQERLKQTVVSAADRVQLRKQIAERVKAEYQLVPPNYARVWEIKLGSACERLRDQPLSLRIKFNTAQGNENSSLMSIRTYLALWEIGPEESPRAQRLQMSLAGDTYHEFAVAPNLFDARGVLRVVFFNPNDTTLLFPLEDSLEVLYREGGFGLNYCRGLGILFCWLALLAAVGMTSASFLSFPVASFFALGMLIIGLSSGTLSQVVEQGGILGINQNTGAVDRPSIVDQVMVPVFGLALKVVNLVQDFSPIDSLSTGRSITWSQLGRAVAQIVVLMGGLIGGVGIGLFTRRELATAQGTP
jgi:hypothetical protein